MSKKLDINKDTIINKLLPIKNFIGRYSVIIFIIAVVSVLSFMTLRIAHYANLEPSDSQIDEKKASLKNTKLDEAAISKIKELQDKNISIESLFDNGRNNPFE